MKRRILLGAVMVLFVLSIIFNNQGLLMGQTFPEGGYKFTLSTRIVHYIQKSDFAYWLEYLRRHILH